VVLPYLVRGEGSTMCTARRAALMAHLMTAQFLPASTPDPVADAPLGR